MKIIIPLPMPTWNRILAMQHMQRIALREYLHHAVSLSLMYGQDWPIQMEFRSKQYSTELFRLEYLQMIRPNKSRKSDIVRLRAIQKSQSLKSRKSK